MEATPGPAFVVIQPQVGFVALEKRFDLKAGTTQAQATLWAGRLYQGGQVQGNRARRRLRAGPPPANTDANPRCPDPSRCRHGSAASQSWFDVSCRQPPSTRPDAAGCRGSCGATRRGRGPAAGPPPHPRISSPGAFSPVWSKPANHRRRSGNIPSPAPAARDAIHSPPRRPHRPTRARD